MATTSFEYDAQRITRVPLDDAERNVVHFCPRHGSAVRVSVCEKCPSWGGYVDTGNIGAAARRYRVYCLEPMPRSPRVVGGDLMVCCPLRRFRMQDAPKCARCDLSGGLRRFPGNWRQRLFRFGPIRQMCAHPIARSFVEIV